MSEINNTIEHSVLTTKPQNNSISSNVAAKFDDNRHYKKNIKSEVLQPQGILTCAPQKTDSPNKIPMKEPSGFGKHPWKF